MTPRNGVSQRTQRRHNQGKIFRGPDRLTLLYSPWSVLNTLGPLFNQITILGFLDVSSFSQINTLNIPGLKLETLRLCQPPNQYYSFEKGTCFLERPLNEKRDLSEDQGCRMPLAIIGGLLVSKELNGYLFTFKIIPDWKYFFMGQSNINNGSKQARKARLRSLQNLSSSIVEMKLKHCLQSLLVANFRFSKGSKSVYRTADLLI